MAWATLAGLPRVLAERGLLGEAAAQLDLTRDTFDGLVAFVMPGDDVYSVAQGASLKRPGGVAHGTAAATIEALDRFIPAPLVGNSSGATVPLSGGVAQLLNTTAAAVNPTAANGAFPSPFARLAFDEKGEVFRRLQTDPTYADTPVELLGGVLIGLVGLIGFSEAPYLHDGAVTEAPLGWKMSGYTAPSDGWDELKGYWRGRRRATGGHRFVRHRHGRPAGRRPRRKPSRA